MYVYIYLCIYIYIHIYVYVYVHAYIHTYIYILVVQAPKEHQFTLFRVSHEHTEIHKDADRECACV